MWQVLRVKGIQAPLFWILVFFSFGIYSFHYIEVIFFLVAASCVTWILLPRRRIDLLLSLACVASGFLRMHEQVERHPKCEKSFANYWACHCPPSLKAPCLCHAKNTPGDWIVEIKKRSFQGRTAFFWGRLDPFNSYGTFDVRTWKYSQNIAGILTPFQQPIVDVLHASPGVLVHEWRSSIRKAFTLNFGEEAQSLLVAIFLGDKSALTKDIKQAFSNAGIGHILAVSGYHIGLIGVIPLLCLKNRRKWLKWLGAALFPMVWFYVWICNAPVSAVRAATMTSFYIMGSALRRPTSPFQCWTLAGLCILIWNPNASMGLGPQLSFAAVASILLFLRALHESGKQNVLIVSFSIPLAAQLGTLAWTANSFGHVSLASLPINILSSFCMSGLGIAMVIWGITELIPVLSKLSVCLESLISDAIQASFECLIYWDRTLNWAPSVDSWHPLIWIYISAAFFALNIIFVANRTSFSIWRVRLLAILFGLLPWTSPWIPAPPYIQTLRSKSQILIGSFEDKKWIVAEKPSTLEYAIHSKSYSQYQFEHAIALNHDEVFSFQSGWIFRDSQGDWNGWIQNRLFSWIRIGEKKTSHKIQWGRQVYYWSEWSPEKRFNLGEADSSRLDPHTLAIQASLKSAKLH